MMLNKLSLNTIGLNRIGLNRIGKPSRGSSDRPYIDPEVLASLKAVCICYGKSNDDPDRAIVKNLVDPDNPFVISNAAYDKMSSYGGYSFAKFDDIIEWELFSSDSIDIISRNGYSITLRTKGGESFWGFRNIQTKGFQSNNIPFKVRANKSITVMWDVYGNAISDGHFFGRTIMSTTLNPDQNTTISLKHMTEEELNKLGMNKDGMYYGIWFNLSTLAVDEEVTIEMLPLFEGAFVTDGVDDLITSTKTVQEMGITKACTVISMIHHIDVPSDASFNNIRNSTAVSGRNGVYASGTTGIYGWIKDNVSGTSTTLINNILGDKNNYTNGGGGSAQVDNMKFSVQGFISDSGVISETSQVAWYWTVIANKVLTTDQINQVIAYFNLDRCVEPTVWYDIQKQGLTNETPAADWYLKDFSKNGFDMSLFNFAKKGDSGIGKYEVDFASLNYNNTTSVFTATYKSCSISKIIKDSVGNIFHNWGQTLAAINPTKIQVTGLDEIGAILEFTYLDESGNSTTKQYSTDGIYDLPASAAYQGDSHNTNFRFSIRGYVGDCDITITQIPSHAGALCSDGVNDYGETNTLPIFRDYTVIADREIIDALTENADGGVALKGRTFEEGAFAFDCKDQVSSFGVSSNKLIDVKRFVSYQSKYTNNGNSISSGNVPDTSRLTIGRMGLTTRYSKFALWSLLLFPYSLSEFLIERQLKKRKAGTLYPDMVEFRPIVKSNVEYSEVSYLNYTHNLTTIKVGEYVDIGDTVGIRILLSNTVDEVVNAKVNGQECEIVNVSPRVFDCKFIITSKSPQKIDITIDEYIRYEDIVQPYPSLFTLIDYDTKETYSWGSKLKVGTKFTGKVINLLPDMYQWDGDVLYNGKILNWTINPGIVAKEMIFSWSKPFKYLFDNNAPKCILSPSRLRIPNSSYKILGYIPDISGHGNHGKINNSAYAGMSGANGYATDFNTWDRIKSVTTVTDNSAISQPTSKNQWLLSVSSNRNMPAFKLKIKGITDRNELGFQINSDEGNQSFILKNGINDIPSFTANNTSGIYTRNLNITDWGIFEIEQVGEYEGAYCLDGVDDFITIPTLSSGGKQVLMKVNWFRDTFSEIVYDQRENLDIHTFAIYNYDNDTVTGEPVVAYNSKNNGNTYIDGILNSNIKASELEGIKHNITITNELVNTNNSISPTIGTNKNKDAHYAQMSLYDFMLFDEISTDEEILTLNEYIGIEGNTDDLFTENN